MPRGGRSERLERQEPGASTGLDPESWCVVMDGELVTSGFVFCDDVKNMNLKLCLKSWLNSTPQSELKS